MFTSHSWGQSGITCAYLGQPSFKSYYQHHSIRCSALSTLARNRKTRRICIGFYAQMERFELSHRLSQSTPLAGEPLEPLGYICLCGCLQQSRLSESWRRERDSNPRCLSTSLVFKTSAINRSAISPCITSSISIAQKTGSVKRICPTDENLFPQMRGKFAIGGEIANLRRKSTVQGIPFLWQYMI